MSVPEHTVIYGYGDMGYHCAGSGCEGGAGPNDWRELERTEIGVLELYRVSPRPAAADADVPAKASEWALALAEASKPWTFDGFRSDPRGYDQWASAVVEGRAVEALAVARAAEVTGLEVLRALLARLTL